MYQLVDTACMTYTVSSSVYKLYIHNVLLSSVKGYRNVIKKQYIYSTYMVYSRMKPRQLHTSTQAAH